MWAQPHRFGGPRKHQGGLAVPPANQGEAVVLPLVFYEGGGGGPGPRARAPVLGLLVHVP